MKRWMKYVVVLSIVAGGVLFTSLQDKFWAWADDGIFNIICKIKGIEKVNLLMIAHGGQGKPVLLGKKEDDPGARTIGYSTYPDSDVLYKSELMRLFILDACVPEDVSPDATVKLDLLHNDGDLIRLWEDQTTPPPPISLPTDFSLQDISLYKSVWVEATAPSESQGDITICAKLIDPDKPSDHSETESTACRDTVTVTAVLVNLSIDSDNTNGLQEPDDSEDEDRIEDDPSKPGKILVVNTWDMNHDGIPNFADGFTTEKVHNAGNTAGGNFVPVVLTLLPDSIDWTNAQVKFHYDASDPGDVGYDDHQTPDDPSDDTYSLPQQGHLRLWTKDGVANRHIDDDYIQSGVAYNITDLLSGDGYTIPLYVEGVQASPADPDLRRIHVDLDPTGDGQFVEDVDAVRVTVVAATDITIYKPESGDFTEPLEWGEIIFHDEPVRAKITLSSEIPALEVFQEKVQIRVFSEETETNWQPITLDQNDKLVSNEIWVTMEWGEFYPKYDIEEFTSVDYIDDDRSNHDDGNAFDELMDKSAGLTRRGIARKDDVEGWNGKEDEFISPVNLDVMKAAGVQFVEFRAPGGQEYKSGVPRHIQNQADYFYYSGHGRHATAHVSLDNIVKFKPEDAKDFWDKDLEMIIFAGCSVFDINDYGRKWLWHAPGDRVRSPGEDWIKTGPQIFLGYHFKAPLDIQGAEAIVTKWVERENLSVNDWLEVNKERPLAVLARPGLNACAINLETTPWEYTFLWENGPEGICEDEICTITYDTNENRWTPLITYSDRWFKESLLDDGSIDNTEPIIITLSGDTWTGSNGEDFVAPGKASVHNLPEGLTVKITRNSDWQLKVTIDGNAENHYFLSFINQYVRFTFQNDAFTSGKAASSVLGYDKTDLAIEFR